MKLKSSNKIVTPLVATEKMRSWCAYQERSQEEARKKLREFKLEAETAENIIVQLIDENFLNEERFAKAFASGKFRIKHWGRVKIRIALKQHKVSDYCIKKALEAIDEAEYEIVLKKVIEKKMELTKTNDERKKKYTVSNHAVSKGFESDLVLRQLNLIIEELQ